MYHFYYSILLLTRHYCHEFGLKLISEIRGKKMDKERKDVIDEEGIRTNVIYGPWPPLRVDPRN